MILGHFGDIFLTKPHFTILVVIVCPDCWENGGGLFLVVFLHLKSYSNCCQQQLKDAEVFSAGLVPISFLGKLKNMRTFLLPCLNQATKPCQKCSEDYFAHVNTAFRFRNVMKPSQLLLVHSQISSVLKEMNMTFSSLLPLL